jgi:hypothetical protein
MMDAIGFLILQAETFMTESLLGNHAHGVTISQKGRA